MEDHKMKANITIPDYKYFCHFVTTTIKGRFCDFWHRKQQKASQSIIKALLRAFIFYC